jgi:polyphosphate kinase 2 (PPK2 family)
MLEKVDLTLALSKAEYKERMPLLQERLLDLQTACWKAQIPSIIVFEGWDAAGKGTTINALTQRLEPRGFRLHAIQAPRTYETHLPWQWRFWLRTPNYGEMAIFDRSWYGRVLVERVEKIQPKPVWSRAFEAIADFERTLADDGYQIIKFFLHISKAEQKRRFKALEKNLLTSWHVQKEDWEHHRKYPKYVTAIEEMFQRTEAEWGPWTLVEATDRRWARVKVFSTIIQRLERALTDRGKELPPPPVAPPVAPLVAPPKATPKPRKKAKGGDRHARKAKA